MSASRSTSPQQERTPPPPVRAKQRSVTALVLRLYAPVAMFIGLFSLAAICLTWMPPAMLLGTLPLPGRWRRRLGRHAICSGLRLYLLVLRIFCFVRIDAQALTRLRHEKSLIWVANHPSLIDAVLFMAYLPNTVCVMKASLQSNLLYGAATRLAHYVSNASPLIMIRQACQELNHGAHLVIFPEGTRTIHWPINPCSPAGAIMAQRAGVPMQEVFIEMSTPYLGKHWGLFRPPVLPLVIDLQLGSRIDAKTMTAPQVAAQIEGDMRKHFTPHSA